MREEQDMAVFISKMNTSSPVHTKTKICNKHFNLNDRLLKSLFRTTGAFECHQCTINFSLINSNLFSITLQKKKKNPSNRTLTTWFWSHAHSCCCYIKPRHGGTQEQSILLRDILLIADESGLYSLVFGVLWLRPYWNLNSCLKTCKYCSSSFILSDKQMSKTKLHSTLCLE